MVEKKAQVLLAAPQIPEALEEDLRVAAFQGDQEPPIKVMQAAPVLLVLAEVNEAEAEVELVQWDRLAMIQPTEAPELPHPLLVHQLPEQEAAAQVSIFREQQDLVDLVAVEQAVRLFLAMGIQVIQTQEVGVVEHLYIIVVLPMVATAALAS